MDQYECIETDKVEDVAVVKFVDERMMDAARIEQLGGELMDAVSGDDKDRVVINFENVSFFSSAAVSKLLVAEKRIRSQGGQLRLSNLRPEVRDVFNLTKLDSVFKIEEEQSDAIESLQ
jgi:anti-anti-sigma factor